MITFSNLIDKFQEFAEDNFFIQSFSHGSPSDVDLDKFELYPLLHVVYTGASYDQGTKVYNLEIYILSLPPSEVDKTLYQKADITNAEQVAEDILADMRNGGNVFDFDYLYEVGSASVTPLEETQSNTLAGCLLDLSIIVPYQHNACVAPLTGSLPL